MFMECGEGEGIEGVLVGNDCNRSPRCKPVSELAQVGGVV